MFLYVHRVLLTISLLLLRTILLKLSTFCYCCSFYLFLGYFILNWSLYVLSLEDIKGE